jgi:hypothetical protein
MLGRVTLWPATMQQALRQAQEAAWPLRPPARRSRAVPGAQGRQVQQAAAASA